VRGVCATWPVVVSWPARALVDLLWPECCALCGIPAGSAPWAPCGARVPGLRAWDLPHLCGRCQARLIGEPRRHEVPLESGGSLLVAAGRAESPELVALAGALKYHGVRGAAWGLSAVATPAVALLPVPGRGAALVPVPLHPARRRERGFNQADLLARLLAAHLGWSTAERIVRRARPTPQQAKIASSLAARHANVRGAFAAAPAPSGSPALCLVDDLATSGQTLTAVAGALRDAGWEVAGAIVAGAGADCGEVAQETRLDSRAEPT
jgi:predicted amidophosphoribosyltransferase